MGDDEEMRTDQALPAAPTSAQLAAIHSSLDDRIDRVARVAAAIVDPIESLVIGETGGKPAAHVGLAIVGELAGIVADLILMHGALNDVEAAAWACGREAGQRAVHPRSHVRVLG